MAEAYGSAFTNQFGDEPNDTWVGGLSTYQPDVVLGAVGRVIKRGDVYAPNLATVIGEIESQNDWEHRLQSRTPAQLEADKQEELERLDRLTDTFRQLPEHALVPEFGDFKSLMK